MNIPLVSAMYCHLRPELTFETGTINASGIREDKPTPEDAEAFAAADRELKAVIDDFHAFYYQTPGRRDPSGPGVAGNVGNAIAGVYASTSSLTPPWTASDPSLHATIDSVQAHLSRVTLDDAFKRDYQDWLQREVYDRGSDVQPWDTVSVENDLDSMASGGDSALAATGDPLTSQSLKSLGIDTDPLALNLDGPLSAGTASEAPDRRVVDQNMQHAVVIDELEDPALMAHEPSSTAALKVPPEDM